MTGNNQEINQPQFNNFFSLPPSFPPIFYEEDFPSNRWGGEWGGPLMDYHSLLRLALVILILGEVKAEQCNAMPCKEMQYYEMLWTRLCQYCDKDKMIR